jgi:hypothetical protein
LLFGGEKQKHTVEGRSLKFLAFYGTDMRADRSCHGRDCAVRREDCWLAAEFRCDVCGTVCGVAVSDLFFRRINTARVGVHRSTGVAAYRVPQFVFFLSHAEKHLA